MKAGNPNRNTSGLIPFKKGFDPRRREGGRPKIDAVVRKRAQDLTPELLERLKELAFHDESYAVQAIRLMLVVAWGPLEKIETPEEESGDGVHPLDGLTVEELRNLARQSLAEAAADDDADDDESTESPH